MNEQKIRKFTENRQVRQNNHRSPTCIGIFEKNSLFCLTCVFSVIFLIKYNYPIF